MKFTFKTKKPVGKYRAFFESHHYIKLGGINVGSIDDEQPHKIRLQVIKEDINEDKNPNCKWKWITLKKESTSIQEAKDFVNANIEKIVNKFKLLSKED